MILYQLWLCTLCKDSVCKTGVGSKVIRIKPSIAILSEHCTFCEYVRVDLAYLSNSLREIIAIEGICNIHYCYESKTILLFSVFSLYNSRNGKWYKPPSLTNNRIILIRMLLYQSRMKRSVHRNKHIHNSWYVTTSSLAHSCSSLVLCQDVITFKRSRQKLV